MIQIIQYDFGVFLSIKGISLEPHLPNIPKRAKEKGLDDKEGESGESYVPNSIISYYVNSKYLTVSTKSKHVPRHTCVETFCIRFKHISIH